MPLPAVKVRLFRDVAKSFARFFLFGTPGFIYELMICRITELAGEAVLQQGVPTLCRFLFYSCLRKNVILSSENIHRWTITESDSNFSPFWAGRMLKRTLSLKVGVKLSHGP